MFSKLWSTVKRATLGERIKDVGRVGGRWGANCGVDVRRGSGASTYVTLTLASNFTFEFNSRTTTYAYLDDEAAERLAHHLLAAVAARRAAAMNEMSVHALKADGRAEKAIAAASVADL